MESKKEIEIINLASQKIKQRKFSDAISLLKKVLDRDPYCTEGYYKIGTCFYHIGDLSNAISAFKKVIELDENHTDASISLSLVLNDIGKYEEAEKVFNKAKNKVHRKCSLSKGDPHLNKKFAQKHFEMGDLYFLHSRFEEANLEYEKACRLDPDNLDTRVKVAKVYAKRGYTEKSYEELRRLKAEHPEYAEGRIALGVLYYGNGQVLEAQNEWQIVLERDPNNRSAKMYLGLSETATETIISSH